MPRIEISPKEYWINRCTYDEAKLYCFQLTIDGKTGWRIFENEDEDVRDNAYTDLAWTEDDDRTEIYSCVPVRDL